jgi:hypothetical protein
MHTTVTSQDRCTLRPFLLFILTFSYLWCHWVSDYARLHGSRPVLSQPDCVEFATEGKNSCLDPCLLQCPLTLWYMARFIRFHSSRFPVIVFKDQKNGTSTPCNYASYMKSEISNKIWQKRWYCMRPWCVNKRRRCPET